MENAEYLRFKILLFQIKGPCNLIGWYQSFGEDILPPSSDGLWMLPQHKHMYQEIYWPNPDHIMNTHHCQHLKSCTKE